MSADAVSPLLDQPGEGLPSVELLLSRMIFAVTRLTDSRASALRRLAAEGGRICALVGALDDNAGARRVLVPRLLGLEDSSRFWSPFMVVEHLVIVDTNMFRIMSDLVAGQAHPHEARIKDFKPAPAAGRTALVSFQKLVGEFEANVPRWPDLHTRCRHGHPWFGALDAHAWLCLAGMHHAIHRRQLEHLLKSS